MEKNWLAQQGTPLIGLNTSSQKSVHHTGGVSSKFVASNIVVAASTLHHCSGPILAEAFGQSGV